MAFKIKKGDEVEIVAGKDKGERGKVLEVLPRKRRVIVEGRNMVLKHQKATQNQEGGIIEKEASLDLSNVMVVDPSDDRPCRVGFQMGEGGKRRISKRTGTVLD
jgi:large subunit ribosomal protein L24